MPRGVHRDMPQDRAVTAAVASTINYERFPDWDEFNAVAAFVEDSVDRLDEQ